MEHHKGKRSAFGKGCICSTMASPTMDDMKLVVKELNERLNKKLNVISYDNLRGEQRVELLLAVFKEIDKTVNFAHFRTQLEVGHNFHFLFTCIADQFGKLRSGRPRGRGGQSA